MDIGMEDRVPSVDRFQLGLLGKMTTKELLGVYNALDPEKPLETWKGKKSVLADRVMRQRAITRRLTTEKVRTIRPSDRESPAMILTLPAIPLPTPIKDDRLPGSTSVRTIRSAAIEHLCAVDHFENRDDPPGPGTVVPEDHPKARSVGVPYDEVIRRIRGEFPNCQTTVACLRWYAVKIRVEEAGYEGLRMPQRRPRVKLASPDKSE